MVFMTRVVWCLVLSSVFFLALAVPVPFTKPNVSSSLQYQVRRLEDSSIVTNQRTSIYTMTNESQDFKKSMKQRHGSQTLTSQSVDTGKLTAQPTHQKTISNIRIDSNAATENLTAKHTDRETMTNLTIDSNADTEHLTDQIADDETMTNLRMEARGRDELLVSTATTSIGKDNHQFGMEAQGLDKPNVSSATTLPSRQARDRLVATRVNRGSGLKTSNTTQSQQFREATNLPAPTLQPPSNVSFPAVPTLPSSLTDDELTMNTLTREQATHSGDSLSSPSVSGGEDCVDEVETQLPEAMEGNVTGGHAGWKKCVLAYSWFVSVPKGYGIIVEFEHVQMEEEDTLTIFSLHTGIQQKVRFFSQTFYRLAPLLRKESSMLIVFTTPLQNDHTHWRNSNFALGYSAHNAGDIPEYALPDFGAIESYFKYFCGGIANLPAAITCDGVRHCEYGEDEKNCPYLDEGCGDWFPHSISCFKGVFFKRHSRIPGSTHEAMPLEAQRSCESKYSATLASLQEPGGMEIAAALVRKSGFMNAVVGLRKVDAVDRRLRHFYRFMWQWGQQGSPIAYDQHDLQYRGITLNCAVLNVKTKPFLEPLPCAFPPKQPQGFICMKRNPTHVTGKLSLPGVTFPRALETPITFPTKECPDGCSVQTFHRCHWGEGDDDDDSGWSPLHLPLFQCRFGRAVHYSLLCDGKDDCPDRGDETNCRKPQFGPLLKSSFICRNLQAIPVLQRCDGKPDCFDESDEELCLSCRLPNIMCPVVGCIPARYASFFDICPQLAHVPQAGSVSTFPAKIYIDGLGMFYSGSLNGDCGEGFFHCQDGNCIPTFLLNNGEQDCPRGEDEGIPADNVTCPGYYRCHGTGNCVHAELVCDGVYHCPNKDDEMFCHVTCPREQGCRCEGWAFTCSRMIEPLDNLHVRYLDISHASNVTLERIHFMEYLFFLNVSSCGLSNVTLVNVSQLQVLDLSDNALTQLAALTLQHLPNLEYLYLTNNHIGRTLGASFTTLLNVAQLSNLRTLVMTNVGLEGIDDKAFSPLFRLEYLDLRKNALKHLVEGSLSGLTALEELHTDESKLCCRFFHPTVSRCYARVDELSSCSDLLSQDFFRAFLWALSWQAIVGNTGVLIYRLLLATRNSASASGILVMNLCLSDLLMGVYMMVIGVADAQFRGEYVAQENQWKTSVTCTVAGFLSFVSSEVSVFVVCLITLDRILVICFPFHSHLHLSNFVTVVFCCGAWVLGCVLAAVPLLTGLEFYGQNGICVPLPITRQQFSGQSYAFAVFIVLNFVLFLFIGVGQAAVYSSVRKAGKAAGTQTRERDMTIARRLLVVVVTDFCCWFPIGLLGLLAVRGASIPGVVNVWAAIFVLPLNSALNPFLYTLNGVLQKRRARRMEQRTKKTLCKLRTEIATWQPASVLELVKICVSSRVMDRETLKKLLGLKEAAPAVALNGAEIGDGENDHGKNDQRETPKRLLGWTETASAVALNGEEREKPEILLGWTEAAPAVALNGAEIGYAENAHGQNEQGENDHNDHGENDLGKNDHGKNDHGEVLTTLDCQDGSVPADIDFYADH